MQNGEQEKRAAPVREKPAPAPVPSSNPAPTSASDSGALNLLTRFEEIQKREVATVRALVELLIERGYFTKEEYLAKMRR